MFCSKELIVLKIFSETSNDSVIKSKTSVFSLSYFRNEVTGPKKCVFVLDRINSNPFIHIEIGQIG